MATIRVPRSRKSGEIRFIAHLRGAQTAQEFAPMVRTRQSFDSFLGLIGRARTDYGAHIPFTVAHGVSEPYAETFRRDQEAIDYVIYSGATLMAWATVRGWVFPTHDIPAISVMHSDLVTGLMGMAKAEGWT